MDHVQKNMKDDAYTVNKALLKEEINCDLCGGDNFTPLFQEAGYTVGQCKICSLYYIRSRPTREEQNEIVEGCSIKECHSSKRQQFFDTSLFRKEECEWYIKTIERFVKNGRFLDVGCGVGTLMWFAANRGWHVEGVELNRDKIEIAKSMDIGKIYTRPVEELNLPEESYDVITMINVFSHLRSPKKTLKHLMTLIKPKGFLLVRTGEMRDVPKVSDLPPWGLGVPHHLTWNSKQTFELYGREIKADIVYYRSIPFNEYFVRNKFKYKSKQWYKQFAKTMLRNIPYIVELFVSWDNWKNRRNPIYDATVIYQKQV